MFKKEDEEKKTPEPQAEVPAAEPEKQAAPAGPDAEQTADTAAAPAEKPAAETEQQPESKPEQAAPCEPNTAEGAETDSAPAVRGSFFLRLPFLNILSILLLSAAARQAADNKRIESMFNKEDEEKRPPEPQARCPLPGRGVLAPRRAAAFLGGKPGGTTGIFLPLHRRYFCAGAVFLCTENIPHKQAGRERYEIRLEERWRGDKFGLLEPLWPRAQSPAT